MKRDALIAIVIVLLLIGGGTAVVVTSRSEFLALIAAEVKRQLSELRPDLSDTRRTRVAQIVAALAAHESGYGSTNQWRLGFNFGNVSRGSWTGPVIVGGDLEYSAGSDAAKRIRQEWRKYVSLSAAVSDWIKLIGGSRYRAARDALFAGDEVGFASGLRAGGYFTAPADKYLAAVRSILGRFA